MLNLTFFPDLPSSYNELGKHTFKMKITAKENDTNDTLQTFR